MNRLQFKARNKVSPKETKRRAKSKMSYDKGCVFCGHLNKCNLKQRKIKCLNCNETYS